MIRITRLLLFHKALAMTDPRLNDLLEVWKQGNANGATPTPAELCRDCPELAVELGNRIATLKQRNGLADESRVSAEAMNSNPGTISFLHAFSASLPPGQHVQLRQPVDEAIASSEQAGRRESVSASTMSPGRYELLGEIGRGGMGTILKGRDIDLGRDIAVKLILQSHGDRPEVLQRFVEEARIAGQLQHPGIVPVYELGQFPDQRLYFTMKLIRGETLAKLLAERASPAQDRPRFLKIFEQICQTIGYAHSRGVIHRDLKPANVMVGAFGEVQVMDWGLAKVLHEQGGAPDEPKSEDRIQVAARMEQTGNATQAGSVLGTPAYMAPEQARGEVVDLDERCDVFGLGAILCEILTGRPAFSGADGANAFQRAVRGDLTDAFARLEGCGADSELIRLTKRSLAPERANRPRDAAVLAAELTAYLNSVEQRLRHAELAGVEAKARADEERRRRDMTVAAQKELQRALTRQVAERLEGELARLEMIAYSLASMVEQREDWDEAPLTRWMDQMLRREDRIFGLCLAFEPGQLRQDQDHYGLYQFRGGPHAEIETKHLGPPQYPYRELDWYKSVIQSGQPCWTEPFVDRDGGDIPMVCFTVPLFRRGNIAGVSSLDLSVKYFARLGDWLKELNFGQQSYGFVISRTGVFISHPQPQYDFASLAAAEKPPRNLTDLDGGDDFRALTRRMLDEPSGSGAALDPATGRPATWLFARVKPAGWTFVVVIDESDDALSNEQQMESSDELDPRRPS